MNEFGFAVVTAGRRILDGSVRPEADQSRRLLAEDLQRLASTSSRSETELERQNQLAKDALWGTEDTLGPTAGFRTSAVESKLSKVVFVGGQDRETEVSGGHLGGRATSTDCRVACPE